jgi:hypothetical protein
MRSVRTISREVATPCVVDPSETIRRASTYAVGEEIVRAAWRHAEAGRNDRPADELPSVEASLAAG